MELLVLQLFFPPVLGYLATTKGYRFWTWAIIGFFVPVVSIFILFALKSRPVIINPENVIVQTNPGKVLYRRPDKEL
jgi:hypothetical protein